MNHRLIAAAMATSISVLGTPSLLAAQSPAAQNLVAPAAGTTSAARTSTGKPVKVKTVSFTLRNDAGTPLTVAAGDQQFTVQPGKSLVLKLQEGITITTVNATAHAAAGGILTTVSSTLQGNTLAIS